MGGESTLTDLTKEKIKMWEKYTFVEFVWQQQTKKRKNEGGKRKGGGGVFLRSAKSGGFFLIEAR